MPLFPTRTDHLQRFVLGFWDAGLLRVCLLVEVPSSCNCLHWWKNSKAICDSDGESSFLLAIGSALALSFYVFIFGFLCYRILLDGWKNGVTGAVAL